MSSLVLGMAVLCAAFLTWVVARALVRVSHRTLRFLDVADGDLRKLHRLPTPRIGGLAVAVGLVAGLLAGGWDGRLYQDVLLLMCVAPGLLWGLIEDVTKRGDVLVRLALSAIAASMGFVLLDARITSVDLPLLDQALRINAVSFAFTVFAVTGVANAMNVIDGLNGLSTVNALLASIALAVVAFIVGDAFVVHVASVFAGALAGFLAVNFPSGRIFLGDGGAYFVGLLVALLSVVLVHRNVEVSAWFPLVLVAYPVWETLFSMYRRKRRGRSTGTADALHLHTLVYRRIVRWKGHGAAPADRAMRNSIASMCLWTMPLLGFVVALAFWNRSLVLQLYAVLFAFFYVAVYRCIVRFGVPRWVVVRAAGAAPMTELDRNAADSPTAEPR